MAHRRALVAFLLLVISAYPLYLRSNKQTRPKPAAKPVAAVKPVPLPANSSDRAIAQHWMRGMRLRDKVAQLVMITSYGESPSSRSREYRDYVKNVRDLKVGGMIVVNKVIGGSVRAAEPYAMGAFLNRMQRLAKVPLLVGGDFERGASMRISGTTKYPHQMAYGAAGDVELTRALGQATAREARALGVHWVFAPVADVNSNPDNPIINIRSFGENPQLVANHVEAYVRGAHSDPKVRVLVTVKHFPGHGDTTVDSHMGMPRLDADRQRLDTTELVPFRAAINAGVDSVMTAHMSVPAVEPDGIPATVSDDVLTNLLRRELRFSGLIVTDAMDMQGLSKELSASEAAVRSIEAGADMLLMPPNPETAINAVVAAVKSGRISEKRIDTSLLRILTAKARVGLHRQKLVNLEKIADVIDSPELSDQAQQAADSAVTLVRNENDAVPLRDPAGTCFFVLAENQNGVQGRRFVEEVKARIRQADTIQLDPRMSPLEVSGLSAKADSCKSVVVAAFVSVGAYRGNVALTGAYPALMESLLARKTPVILVALGSPYLLRSVDTVPAYITTFSPAATAEAAAVKALFGEIPIQGKMPVSIPGLVAAGGGIMLPRKAAATTVVGPALP